MAGARWIWALGRLLAKTVAVLLVLVLLLVAAGLAVLQTPWAKNRLRSLIVTQANRYLTATLEIGRLEGSLLFGARLYDVRLTREDTTIVAISDISIDYDFRQFFDDNIAIDRIALVNPRITAARQADGRWNLAALVRPPATPRQPSGSRRPILLRSITITEGEIVFRDPLKLGAMQFPAAIDRLDVDAAFTYRNQSWNLDLNHVSWSASETDLAMDRLSGTIASDQEGTSLSNLVVDTRRSMLTVNGRVIRATPTVLDLQINARPFSFQEWAAVLPALRRISIEANFDVALKGPTRALEIDLDLTSNGGAIDGPLVLNTSVPGWHARGSLELAELNLAHWLTDPERPSDITGTIDFDLDLDLGGRFPRGPYSFAGPHVAFMDYEADALQAHGVLRPDDVQVQSARARAYGAAVRVDAGSIGINAPFPFRFQGAIDNIDLRRLPLSIPVPHVESRLTLDYDASGQFRSPFLVGHATFSESEFIGGQILAGTAGSIDTSSTPVRYSGEAVLADLALERVASEFEIEWLGDPRYRGTISGHFTGAGTIQAAEDLEFQGGGHIDRAELFGGSLTDAETTLVIRQGSLSASYQGRFEQINPAIALNDERFVSTLTGSGLMQIDVRDLLRRSPGAEDYTLSGQIDLENSIIRDLQIDSATLSAQLSEGMLSIERTNMSGPLFQGAGSGSIGIGDRLPSSFDYNIDTDLSILEALAGRSVSGRMTTAGRLDGVLDRPHLTGHATVNRLIADDIQAAVVVADYDLTLPQDRRQWMATIEGRGELVQVAGDQIDEVAGKVAFNAGRVDGDLQIFRGDRLGGRITTSGTIDLDEQRMEFSAVRIELESSQWVLLPSSPLPFVTWNNAGIEVTATEFGDAAGGPQRIGVRGTWLYDGSGALHLTANDVPLETISTTGTDSYGGILDLDAVVSGTRARPIITGSLTITDGRVRNLAYELLSGRVEYVGGYFEVGLRLDQSPGVWLTASGAFPLGLIDRTQPERPMHVAIASTPISLGLIEGLTTQLVDVTGQIQLNLTAAGTGHKPVFLGTVGISDVGFELGATGATYTHGTGMIELTTDRLTVHSLSIQDAQGQVLQVTGSAGTRELRIQDIDVSVTGRNLEVLRNDFGRTDVDARLTLSGQIDQPQLEGSVTVTDGELRVDRILDRVLFRPYATQARPEGPVDAIAALNPWERLGLRVDVHVPGTLRMLGDNVQVAAGTPLGVGDIDLRVAGDLVLRKDPQGILSVTGTLDRITGRYSFQGRRFDLDPSSTITFTGDLNPELFIVVQRLISGVETRVTITGTLNTPELRLASVPPLEPSDILSLIVFNTPANQLSAAQQEELAVRAGTLAAGFFAAPLVSALERSLGLDMLEIEAAGTGGARVTIGEELAPGLVARFSRQFGAGEYDEATIEYYLSRILRIRATFSDAGAAVSPFRRVERAGVDLLLFFSF